MPRNFFSIVPIPAKAKKLGLLSIYKFSLPCTEGSPTRRWHTIFLLGTYRIGVTSVSKQGVQEGEKKNAMVRRPVYLACATRTPPLGGWVGKEMLCVAAAVPKEWRFLSLCQSRYTGSAQRMPHHIINLKAVTDDPRQSDFHPHFTAGKSPLNTHKYTTVHLCRLHTAFLHWPLSSAATKEVQGPDTTCRRIQGPLL